MTDVASAMCPEFALSFTRSGLALHRAGGRPSEAAVQAPATTGFVAVHLPSTLREVADELAMLAGQPFDAVTRMVAVPGAGAAVGDLAAARGWANELGLPVRVDDPEAVRHILFQARELGRDALALPYDAAGGPAQPMNARSVLVQPDRHLILRPGVAAERPARLTGPAMPGQLRIVDDGARVEIGLPSGVVTARHGSTDFGRGRNGGRTTMTGLLTLWRELNQLPAGARRELRIKADDRHWRRYHVLRDRDGLAVLDTLSRPASLPATIGEFTLATVTTAGPATGTAPPPARSSATARGLETIPAGRELTVEQRSRDADEVRDQVPRYLRDNLAMGLARQRGEDLTHGIDLEAMVGESIGKGAAAKLHEARELIEALQKDVEERTGTFLGDGKTFPTVVDGRPAELTVKTAYRWETLEVLGRAEEPVSVESKSSAKQTAARGWSHRRSAHLAASGSALPIVYADGRIAFPGGGADNSYVMKETQENTASSEIKVKDAVHVALRVDVTTSLVIGRRGGEPLVSTRTGDARLDVPQGLHDPAPDRAVEAIGPGRRLPGHATAESVYVRLEPGEKSLFDQITGDDRFHARLRDLDAPARGQLRKLLDDLTGRLHELEQYDATVPDSGLVTSETLTPAPGIGPRHSMSHSNVVGLQLRPVTVQLAQYAEGEQTEKYDRSAEEAGAFTAGRTYLVNAMGGAGANGVVATAAGGLRIMGSHTGEHRQERTVRTAAGTEVTYKGEMVRYKVVYEPWVQFAGEDAWTKLAGAVESFQWAERDQYENTTTTRHGDDRQLWAEQERYQVFTETVVDDMRGGQAVYDLVRKAFAEVPKPKGHRIRVLGHELRRMNPLIGTLSDARYAKLERKLTEALRRDRDLRRQFDDDELGLLLTTMVDNGLQIPLVYEGRLHNYETTITVRATTDDMADGDLRHGGHEGLTKKKEKTGTIGGKDVGDRLELSLEARAAPISELKRVVGPFFGSLRLATAKSRTERLGIHQSGRDRIRYGPSLRPDGSIAPMTMRTFSTRMRISVESTSYRHNNTTMNRLTVGRLGLRRPKPIEPPAIPRTELEPIELRLSVPEYLVRDHRPVPAEPREVTWEPITDPTPLRMLESGVTREHDTGRLMRGNTTPLIPVAMAAMAEVAGAEGRPDPYFDLDKGAVELALSRALQPDTMRGRFLSHVVRIPPQQYGRRVNDVVTEMGLRLTPRNLRIDDSYTAYEEVEHTKAGGVSASRGKDRQFEVSLNVSGNARPDGLGDGLLYSGASFVRLAADLFRRGFGRSHRQEFTATSKSTVKQPPRRVYLVTLDYDAEMVMESWKRNNLDRYGWFSKPDVRRVGRRGQLLNWQRWMSYEEIQKVLELDRIRRIDGVVGALRATQADQVARLRESQRAEIDALGARLAADRADILRLLQHQDPSAGELGKLARTARQQALGQQLLNLSDRYRTRLAALREEHALHHAEMADQHARELRTAEEEAARARSAVVAGPEPYGERDTIRPVPQGNLAPPPIHRVRDVPAAERTAPSLGLGAVVNQIDESAVIDDLRDQLTGSLREHRLYPDEEAAAAAALRLLPRENALARPNDNITAVREFLRDVDRHFTGVLTDRVLPLRLEDKMSGHTFFLHAGVAVDEPAFLGVQNVDLSVAEKMQSTTTTTKSTIRTLFGLTGGVRVQQMNTFTPPDVDTHGGKTMVNTAAGLSATRKFGVRDVKRTDTEERGAKQQISFSGPAAAWSAPGELTVFLTHGGRYDVPSGEHTGTRVAEVTRPVTVDLRNLPADTLPAPAPARRTGGVDRPAETRLGATTDMKLLWRDLSKAEVAALGRQDGRARLPDAEGTDAGDFAIERFLVDPAAMTAAAGRAAQLIAGSGGRLDGANWAALVNGLSAGPVAAGERYLRNGGFVIPMPSGPPRFLHVYAEIENAAGPRPAGDRTPPRLAGADARVTLTSGRKDASKQKVDRSAGGDTLIQSQGPAGNATYDPSTATDKAAAGSTATQYQRDLYDTKHRRTDVDDQLDHTRETPASTRRPEFALTRTLSYDVRFRFVVTDSPEPSGPRAAAAGFEFTAYDAMIVRLWDEVAERLTGSRLPDAVRRTALDLAHKSKAYGTAITAHHKLNLEGSADADDLIAKADAEIEAHRLWAAAVDAHLAAVADAQRAETARFWPSADTRSSSSSSSLLESQTSGGLDSSFLSGGSSEDVTTPAEDVTTPAEDVTTPAEDVITPAEDVTTPAERVTTPAEAAPVTAGPQTVNQPAETAERSGTIDPTRTPDRAPLFTLEHKLPPGVTVVDGSVVLVSQRYSGDRSEIPLLSELRAVATGEYPVILLDGDGLGAPVADADLMALWRVLSLLSADGRALPVFTQARIGRPVEQRVAGFGAALARRAPDGLGTAWMVHAGDGRPQRLGPELTPPVVFAAYRATRPPAEAVDPDLLGLLLTRRTADTRAAVYRHRERLTSPAVLTQMDRVVEQAAGDPWLAKYRPVLQFARIGRAGTALDYQERLGDPAARNEILLGATGGDIPTADLLRLATDSGGAGDHEPLVLRAVGRAVAGDVDGAVASIYAARPQLRATAGDGWRTDWVDLIGARAAELPAHTEALQRVAAAVLDCRDSPPA